MLDFLSWACQLSAHSTVPASSPTLLRHLAGYSVSTLFLWWRDKHQTEGDGIPISWPTKEKYLCVDLFSALPQHEHMSWIND